ncbi:MAG: radical SAM/SPASM domain-containing protein [Minicystis sp.]
METWFHRPATPTRVVLDVTRRCNLRCSMCRTWRVAPEHELSPAEIGEILGQMPRLTWLDITGGEPFLRRDADEVFDAVLANTPALRMLHYPTNGWFTDRIARTTARLAAQRPEVELIVTVSIDGPRAVHDEVRGQQGSFDRALATFKALRALPNVATYVGTTVTPFNAATVEELGRVLAHEIDGFQPTEWHWNWLQISGHFFDNADLAALPAVKTGDLVRHHLSRRGAPRSMVDWMELAFLLNLEFYRRGEPSGIVCQALRSTAFISPEGDLYPCHVYDRKLANLRGADVQKTWASPEVVAARRDIERLACGGCFTPCEAYPALAGAPVQTLTQTARRSLKLVEEQFFPRG